MTFPLSSLRIAAAALLMTVAQSAGAEPPPGLEQRTPAATQRAWGWIATAAGSSLLFTSAYAYTRAGSLTGDVPARCDDRSRDGEAGCDSARWRRMFWMTGPLGAATATAGIVLLATAPIAEPDRRTWHIGAAPGPRDLTLRVGATF